MAVELSMVSIDMVGSDAVNEDENYRHSIADNDDAENDVSHPSGNAQQRHGYCTKRWKLLCLVVVSVIATIIAAVIAAVLIPRQLNQEDSDVANKSVDGVWGMWGSISECSRTCGGGTKTRHRACDSPAASNGGAPCPGDVEEAHPCNTVPCPVTGGWGQWSSYSECSQTCGGGTRTHQRACDSPAPAYGGAPCYGDANQTQSCNNDPCPEDCSGIAASGVYNIFPSKIQTAPVPVYCDVSSDGAWTVIQKRYDGSVDFTRTWEEYRTGFGNVSGEYWLGNEALHHITSRGNYTLKIVLTDWEGVTKVAEYSTFRINNESDAYRLTLQGYSGDAGNSLLYNKEAMFSTPDRDNDFHPSFNCAEVYGQAGWWYGQCTNANLNGVYHHSPNTTDTTAIWWGDWHGSLYSLKATTMMVRKT